MEAAIRRCLAAALLCLVVSALASGTTRAAGVIDGPESVTGSLMEKAGPIETAVHEISITAGPGGSPNPLAAGATASLSVNADDSSGHPLEFLWASSCPSLPSDGAFDHATAQAPSWTAPANPTGSRQDCTIQVTVSDGFGLSQDGSYVHSVGVALPATILPADIQGIQHTASGRIRSFLAVEAGRYSTVAEYDLTLFGGPASPSTIGTGLRNLDPGGSPGIIDVYSYTGDGVVAPAEYLAGTYLTSVSFDDARGTINIDVTPAVEAALEAGASHLGLRFSTHSSDRFRLGPDSGFQLPRLTAGGPTPVPPLITGFDPPNVAEGSPDLTLRVIGLDFVPGAVVQWNGSDRPTTQAGSLLASIPSSDLVTPGTASLTVFTPGPLGGVSPPAEFVVRAIATYYVDDDATGDPAPGDPNASDPLEDGSIEHPFDTIQEALDIAYPEDTIRVLPGLYVEDLQVRRPGFQLEGSGRGATIIRSASGRFLRATIPHSPPSLIIAVRDLDLELGELLFDYEVNLSLKRVNVSDGDISIVNGPSVAEIDDVSLRNADMSFGQDWTSTINRLDAPSSTLMMSTLHGLSATTLTNSVLGTLSTISGVEGDSLNLDVTETIFVSGAVVTQYGDGRHTVLFDGCAFGNNGLHVIDTSSGDGRDSVRVHRSVFHGSGIRYDGSVGFWEGASATVNSLEVDGSRFIQGPGISINVFRPFTGPGHDVRVANNVFDHSSAGVDVSYSFTPSGLEEMAHHHLEVVNNTFFGTASGIAIQTEDHDPGHDTLTTLITNNIIAFGGSGITITGQQDQEIVVSGNDVYDNADGNYLGDLPDQTGLNGNISANPWFAESVTGDYRLRPFSPCIDAGAVSAEVPDVDHDGIHRPLDGDGDLTALPDIGAFEFIRDADSDGVPDDGDLSGDAFDNPCTCGATAGCDDNCPAIANPDQADRDCDGIGNVCDNRRWRRGW